MFVFPSGYSSSHLAFTSSPPAFTMTVNQEIIVINTSIFGTSVACFRAIKINFPNLNINYSNVFVSCISKLSTQCKIQLLFSVIQHGSLTFNVWFYRVAKLKRNTGRVTWKCWSGIRINIETFWSTVWTLIQPNSN